jgi:hypothetical protein
VTVAPLARLIGRPFYDLTANVEVMQRLWDESVVDGFEFQNLAEWDAANPPRDEGERRLAYWTDSRRYTVEQIADKLLDTGLPILSVHANRDVGILLCSDRAEDLDRGKRLVRESLWLASEVGAGVCVFHLWDTWKEAFDVSRLHGVLGEIAPLFPEVRASVENVPTHLPGCAPFDLASQFQWITLDLRWAALYDEWERFEALAGRIASVHLHGRVVDGHWALEPEWALSKRTGFYRVLNAMCNRWGYSGLLTVERVPHDVSWAEFVSAVATLTSGLASEQC